MVSSQWSTSLQSLAKGCHVTTGLSSNWRFPHDNVPEPVTNGNQKGLVGRSLRHYHRETASICRQAQLRCDMPVALFGTFEKASLLPELVICSSSADKHLVGPCTRAVGGVLDSIPIGHPPALMPVSARNKEAVVSRRGSSGSNTCHESLRHSSCGGAGRARSVWPKQVQ